jgi:hypothetical protein
MKLTNTQKKWAWIAGSLLVSIHFAPAFVSGVRRAFSGPPPAVLSKPSAAHAIPPPVLPPIAVPFVDPQFTRLSGIWVGKIVRPGGITCGLRLELRPSQAKPSEFTGYSVLSCGPSFLQIQGGPASMRTLNSVLNQSTPISTISSGPVIDGAIQLHLDQTIGKTPDGCHPTEFTLTPFGDNNLAAKWQEPPCADGQTLMQRSPR